MARTPLPFGRTLESPTDSQFSVCFPWNNVLEELIKVGGLRNSKQGGVISENKATTSLSKLASWVHAWLPLLVCLNSEMKNLPNPWTMAPLHPGLHSISDVL